MIVPAPSVKIESGMAVIALPGSTAADLLAELAECPCAGHKSTATIEVRDKLRAMLAEPPVVWPMWDVHGLRVGLADCPCRGPLPGARSLKQRLSRALAKRVAGVSPDPRTPSDHVNAGA